MTYKTLPYKIAMVLILLLALPAAIVNAQEVDGDYINGHNLTGEFYTFYQNAPEPLRIFGYPITEAFTDPYGTRMQYFQRARLEIKAGEVIVSDLGWQLYDTTIPVKPVPTNTTYCDNFGTKYNVCYEFLLFYEQHNGEKYFGKPISKIFRLSDTGPSMQYFENALMVYHPDAATGEKIAVSDLGRMHFDMLRHDPALLDLLAQPNEDQTIYVIVQDAQLQPVENATVYVTLRFPDGSLSSTTRIPSETDENGVCTQPFTVPDYPVNEIIQMDVSIEYNGSNAETTTWFRIWW